MDGSAADAHGTSQVSSVAKGSTTGSREVTAAGELLGSGRAG